MKKWRLIVIILASAVILWAAWYTLSPIFRNVELHEPMPESTVVENARETPVADIDLTAAPLEATETHQAAQPTPARPPEAPKSITEPARFPVIGTRGHRASGSVVVLETPEGTIIRYEDFDTINGPDLRVYLSHDLEASEYADIGTLRATQGDINYLVPEGIQMKDYSYVLIWCKPFGVLFNYARLR